MQGHDLASINGLKLCKPAADMAAGMGEACGRCARGWRPIMGNEY